MDIAIEHSAPGVKWSEIVGQMESCAKSAGFSVVTDFVGHGIGVGFHLGVWTMESYHDAIDAGEK